MYLNIGSDMAVRDRSIIGIFDMDNTTSSHITRKFLNNMEKMGRIVNIAEDIPKTFVLCDDMGKITVYLSQLSSQTLLKRSTSMSLEG